MSKKTILIIATFLLLFRQGFSQDYALWTSTKPYESVLGGSNYHASYSKLVDDWILFDPDSGIYTNIPETPITASAIQYQQIMILNVPQELCDGGGIDVLNKYEQFVFGHNGQIQLCYDVISDEHADYATVWQYAVVLPNYVQPLENNRKHNDLLFKTAQNNFQDQINDVSGVKWRYSFDNNFNFKDFPEDIKHQFPLKATVGKILGNEQNANSIQNLRVKMVLDVPNSIIPLIESDILLFTIESSSPELLDLTPHKTSCPGAEDGSFTMTVDRDLENEKLVVSVYDANDLDGGILQQEAPTTLIDNGDETYSYVFPEILVENSYVVKYQTIPNVENQNLDDLLWDSLEFSDPFTIEPPEEVTFTLEHLNDVYCFSGSDGRIGIEAYGGTGGGYQYRVNGGSWNNFSNGSTHTLSGLSQNDYEIEVRDGNYCEGTSQDNTETIKEPPESIAFDNFVEYGEPTAFGFTDGSISVWVNGGTPGYLFQWLDQDNNPINTTQAEDTQQGYKITAHSISSGVYTLRVTDANYNVAVNKGGCVLIQDFELIGPPKLQLNIEETIPISCNSANNYNNPSNDGQLTAIASGGVPFAPLIDGQYAYLYTWKKKDGQNNWQIVPNVSGNVLDNLEEGEYAVNIEDANGIVVGTYVNNVLQQANDEIYLLEEPELLTVQIEKTDINCFGGIDGTATTIINGGTPPFEILWSTGATTETAEGLWLGNHSVYVVDALGCEAEAEVTIEQPDEPVAIENPEFVEPTANGFTDGSITVLVNGGTPFNDNSYAFEWRNEQDVVINTTMAQSTPEGYVVQVQDIPAGLYTLTVTDANFNNAIQKEGCTNIMEFELTEPPPLQLAVEQTSPISCNGGNQFNNPSDDGQLTAIASGGVPFDPLIDGQYAYIYTWKKKDGQNNWQTIPNVTGNILDNVEASEYAVNIEDANGIIMGIYVDNVLQEPTDYVYPVQETEPITLQLDKMDVSCFGGNNGFASVSIEGGMPPFEVTWSSGANGEIAENLLTGIYFVYVRDFYGCEASGQISIEEPPELEVHIIETVVPTCYDADNGSISVSISGGVAPYRYLWNTGDNVLSLSNLVEGTYTLEVMDATGCTTTKEIQLSAPFPSEVDLGGDRVLCSDQHHYLDISVNDPEATYLWTSSNGFHSTSPQVDLSEAGIYTATVTNSLGCSDSDTIRILNTEVEIDSQFLITSQAFTGEEVVLVNTSDPIGTNEEWIFPEGATVVEKMIGMAIIRFDEPGAYEIVLRNYQGDCYQDLTKTVIVAEAKELPDSGDTIAPFIKEFKVYPNPSSGIFTVSVLLQKETTASLRLFALTTNLVHAEVELQGSLDYEVPFSLNLTSGTYLLLLETSQGRQIRKIVIL